jgi:hypothetical protein
MLLGVQVTNFLGFYNGTALLKEVVVMQNLMGAGTPPPPLTS